LISKDQVYLTDGPVIRYAIFLRSENPCNPFFLDIECDGQANERMLASESKRSITSAKDKENYFEVM
jgi:hypothetical protein